MAYFTQKSRYKEHGLVVNFEYRTEDRVAHSIPVNERLTTYSRPTFYRSELQTLTHVVKFGETIHQIASYYYRDARLWWFIADYNPLLDFNALQVDDELIIPPNTEVNAY